MTGSEKITFSPVFIARSSLRMMSAGTPRATMAPAMISHSDRSDPGVTPPLTIAQRKYPFAPQPAGFIDALVDVLARAEHEQQVRRP